MRTLVTSALFGALLFGCGMSPATAADKGKAKDPEQVFKKRDKDGNGSLSRKEFERKKGADKAKTRFDKLDKDKDGKVTLAELKSRKKSKKG